MNKIIYILSCLFLSSCNTYYSTTNNAHVNTSELLENSKRFYITKSINVYFDGLVNYGNESYKVKGNLKIESADRYQINLYSKKYGVEVARMSFTDDSIVFLNKLNKNYYSGKIADFKYLNSSIKSSEAFLRILMGRNDHEANYTKVNDTIHTYENMQGRGKIVLNNYGFNKEMSFSNGQVSTQIFYEPYFKKYSFPSGLKIIGKIEQAKFLIDIKNRSIVKFKNKLEVLTIPNNYKSL